MSFILWYQLEFLKAGLLGGPLRVSNDVYSGDYILDANITVTMSMGAAADTMEAHLMNLPADIADTLRDKSKDQEPLQIKIRLGYFDDLSTKAESVMLAAVTSIKSTVNEDGQLITIIKGQELGGYRLRTATEAQGKQGSVKVDEFVKALVKDTDVELDSASVLSHPPLENFTLIGRNKLAALNQIARRINSPLVIRDNTIYLGASIGSKPSKCKPWTLDSNIVKLDRSGESEEKLPSPTADKNATPDTTKKAVTILDAVVLGDPQLRVGETVLLHVDGYPKEPLRIDRLVHHFSMSSGFTSEVRLVDAKPGEVVNGLGGIPGLVDSIGELVESTQKEQLTIDVGQVVDYQPGDQKKHRASLNYGQTPSSEVVLPSIKTPVDEKVQLFEMPVASLFAWHKCGLIVPIYKGMRAILAHNRGLVSDAIVAGFVWPDNPQCPLPESQPGDYWLCLPTEIGTDDLPTGKAANDLVDRDGRRVIQSKALHILVATDKLPEIGKRPTIPAEKTITIEHETGTKITIDEDGGVTIQSSGPVNVSTNSKEISLTNSSVTLKLNGSAVEVS